MSFWFDCWDGVPLLKSLRDVNPFKTGRLFHCHRLGKSIFNFWGVGSIFFFAFIYFFFNGKSC